MSEGWAKCPKCGDEDLKPTEGNGGGMVVCLNCGALRESTEVEDRFFRWGVEQGLVLVKLTKDESPTQGGHKSGHSADD